MLVDATVWGDTVWAREADVYLRLSETVANLILFSDDCGRVACDALRDSRALD